MSSLYYIVPIVVIEIGLTRLGIDENHVQAFAKTLLQE